MLKNKPYLVTVHESILVSLGTFQLTVEIFPPLSFQDQKLYIFRKGILNKNVSKI